ncbi:phosphoribosyl-AMP cyclohydrolase [Parasphingopyxis sp. CP4]|uniref:phosphoribosyl-AMP cyclohydrolase n=1 Tax=Parasphingopyxis sp. CP4 TaxID=2724527 RepID=UPI0015A0C5A5|nr:phosphoribosyl-AMP cyclohydrolase [Parasphingopyxis sp. CP4]QLC21365.1 phosphoribosyl-AMP cyclohydrolase [Parasphingopyxis sp. CP4]
MDDSRETGSTLKLKFDAAGLITAVVSDWTSNDVLMVAHMNREALDLTVETQIAHFWSRSRQALWKKGETSGNILRVADIRIDCDQDAVWLIVDAAGPACHTGEMSCFYRRVTSDGLLAID